MQGMPCQHDKLQSTCIILHPTGPGELHRAVFSIRCETCKAPFRFAAGDGAVSFDDDRTALSAWIVEVLPSRVQ